jgi:hypothetical protein
MSNSSCTCFRLCSSDCLSSIITLYLLSILSLYCCILLSNSHRARLNLFCSFYNFMTTYIDIDNLIFGA